MRLSMGGGHGWSWSFHGSHGELTRDEGEGGRRRGRRGTGVGRHGEREGYSRGRHGEGSVLLLLFVSCCALCFVLMVR
jgi:hypothetical protein